MENAILVCCQLSNTLTSSNSIILFFVTADLISTVEFNHNGDLLATGDKGGRIVIFQKDEAVSY